MAYHYTKPDKITEKLQVYFRDQYKHNYPPTHMGHLPLFAPKVALRFDGIIRLLSKLFNVQVRRDKFNAVLPYYVIGHSALPDRFIDYLNIITNVVEDNTQFYMQRYKNKRHKLHGHEVRAMYRNTVIQRFEAELIVMIEYKASLKFAAVRKVDSWEIAAQNGFNEYAKNYNVLKTKTPFKFYNPK